MRIKKRALATLLIGVFALLMSANVNASTRSYLINIWNTQKVVSGQTFTSNTFTPKSNAIQLYYTIQKGWRSDSSTVKLQEYISGNWYTVRSESVNGLEGWNFGGPVDKGEKYRVLVTYTGETKIRDIVLQVSEYID